MSWYLNRLLAISVLIEMNVSLGNLFSNETMTLHVITDPFFNVKERAGQPNCFILSTNFGKQSREGQWVECSSIEGHGNQ